MMQAAKSKHFALKGLKRLLAGWISVERRQPSKLAASSRTS